MPIQTNVPLVSTSGLQIPTGSYCVLNVVVDPRRNMEVTMLFYKDKAAFDNIKETPFLPNNPNLEPRYLRQLTLQEYAQFTFTLVHQLMQSYLEQFFGPGNTQIVA